MSVVKPAFCSTRHSRCAQHAHSCYVVTGFRGIRTRVFQTRVKRANQSDTMPPSCCRQPGHVGRKTLPQQIPPVPNGGAGQHRLLCIMGFSQLAASLTLFLHLFLTIPLTTVTEHMAQLFLQVV